MVTRRSGQACLILLLAACAWGCYQEQREGTARETVEAEGEGEALEREAAAEPARAYAVARIEPRSGSQAGGTAKLISEGGSISLSIEIESAPPGSHAIHIHETGDCSATDASSAGGHWNPTHEDHGKWGEAPHHLGDIGNIDVAEDGTGTLTMITDKWEIGTGGQKDIVGRSIILHEKLDDFATQPTGAAGGRIGCGIIEIVR